MNNAIKPEAIQTKKQPIYALGFQGLKVFPIKIEVSIKRGMPKFNIIGLAQNAVLEGRGRITAALAHLGINCADYAITVNLMPAAVKKDGTLLDLAIAVAILSALGKINPEAISKTLFCGELSLQGDVLPIQGAIATLLFAIEHQFEGLVLSSENRMPGSDFKNDLNVCGIDSLQHLIEILSNKSYSKKFKPLNINQKQSYAWHEIKGQHKVKRALEIAVAGEHNVLLLGPPGVGKSFMAKRLTSIYPKPRPIDQQEIMKIKSFNMLDEHSFDASRPFQMPHHTSSLAGMVGGGKPFKMGEFTRAHKGILCLDEVTEFRRDILESLREALENHEIEVVRSEGHFNMPAEFMLVATSNLCPCGGRGENKAYCQCSYRDIQKYMNKISKPVRERIDMIIYIPKVAWSDVKKDQSSSNKGSDREIEHKVEIARQKQSQRYGNSNKTSNAKVNGKDFWMHNKLSQQINQQIETWTHKNLLSFRRVEKMLRVARSIADYENSDAIELKHVQEAYYYQRWPKIE